MGATYAETQVLPYYLNTEEAGVRRASAKRDDSIFRRGSKSIRGLLIWQIILTLYLRSDSSRSQPPTTTVSLTLKFPNTTSERFSMENKSINPEHVHASVLSGHKYALGAITDPRCTPDVFALIAFSEVYRHYNLTYRIIPHDSVEFIEFTSMVSQELAKLIKDESAESIQEYILKECWK
jgi:hypothetical protein